MNFIRIDLKTDDGGFMIPDSPIGREIANELLKDPKYKKGEYTKEMFDNLVMKFKTEVEIKFLKNSLKVLVKGETE